MVNISSSRAQSLQARIVSGSFILLSGSCITAAINLGYNIVIARDLGPRVFGHATVVYTLLILLSAVTLSFQIVSAKVVAQQTAPEEKAAAYRAFHRSAWACGLTVAVVLYLFQSQVSGFLNVPDPALVALIAAGTAFYVPLGCRRGFIQGTCGFRSLAINLALEGFARLGGSYLLLLFGFGARGVIAANAAAIALCYIAIPPRLGRRVPNPICRSRAVGETLQALSFFSGQVLINNCDIVLVKHLFPSREAGLYAAVAMVGRVIFSFSTAVVNTTFPLIAGAPRERRQDFRVIATPLLLVSGIGAAFAVALCFTPPSVWTMLFGSGFRVAGRYGLSYLQAIYALKTLVYSLSVVLICYEMSYKIANTNWIQLAFSGILIAGICEYHSSLRAVIFVQLVILCGLFVSVAVPFFIGTLAKSEEQNSRARYTPVRLVRRVSEDHVIAEFLRSDFNCPEFEQYGSSLREIVMNPNLDDPGENVRRRALFFKRHLSLWSEIPVETEWYEVEVDEAEIGGIRVFPRAHWRKLARGEFSITGVVRTIRTQGRWKRMPFLLRLNSIARRLKDGGNELGAVILIGVSANDPLTILDGNHRLVAALLASPCGLPRLRFVCGLSPRMTECCWYNTSVSTLFRYGKNVLSRVIRNPAADLTELLKDAG